MRMLSNKILTWYMRQREYEHAKSRTQGNYSSTRQLEIENQKQHMSDAHDKIQRQGK